MAQQLGHVLGILAQRRHANDDDAQVRKQLGPQRVAALEALERAAQDAAVERAIGRLPVHAIAALLERAQQYALRLRANLAELLDEQDAVFCALESPRLGAVAKQLALRVLVVQIAAHDGDERAARLRALAREEAREQLASAAGLTREQRVRVVLRDARDLLAQRTHRLTLAGRHGVLRGDAAPLLLVAAHGERSFHRAQQLRERNGLLDEIDGAEARGLDGRVDGAVARHHDDGARRAALRPFAQQRDAVGVGHPDIEQDEIELLPFARAARFLRVGGRRDVVAFFAQDLIDQSPNVGLVVDNQNSRAHARSLL